LIPINIELIALTFPFAFLPNKIYTMKKEGIKSYYQAKIEECELVMNEKSQDLRRLEAQRNALNAKGKGKKKSAL
jgi:hypothetical protein